MKVTLVEFSVFERVAPLVSGYLQAYAATDPTVRDACHFEKYITTVKTPAERITRDLINAQADVYAFSCYVWNMGLVRSILPALRLARPRAHFILGGPQVMHHAAHYLDPADERTAVCNGEGEVTFTHYLRALAERWSWPAGGPDLRGVHGISFYDDHELITTPARPRIADLDSIPSPFLTGVFGAEYSMSILETNRGCPFRCGFCFWGAATNDRVYRFDEQRVKDEITWMAGHGILFLYIADANWGMLSRDVQISEHIADCARRYRSPNVVYFSASKNKPRTVTQIASIFQDAGLVTSQPVSLQTLDSQSLELVSRSNIRLSAFAEVQQDLRAKNISSFIELIWPLPGETLDSFKKGISTLCDNDAQTIIAYPHLLLHNTPLDRSAGELGLVTRPVGGAVSDARVVTATSQVSERDFAEGMRYFYAVHALHNTRSLYAVERYLVKAGALGYGDLYSAFADFWRDHCAGDPVASYVEKSIGDADYYDVNNYGIFIHTVLHAHRAEFADEIRRFARSQPWWDSAVVPVLFDIDALSRPYIYSNTPLESAADTLGVLRVVNSSERAYTVQVPTQHLPLVADAVGVRQAPADGLFVVNHKRMQYPFMAAQSLDHNGSYCHGMIEKIGNILPSWQPARDFRPGKERL